MTKLNRFWLSFGITVVLGITAIKAVEASPSTRKLTTKEHIICIGTLQASQSGNYLLMEHHVFEIQKIGGYDFDDIINIALRQSDNFLGYDNPRQAAVKFYNKHCYNQL